MLVRKKIFVILLLFGGMIFLETSARIQENKDGITTRNLRVIKRNISHEELIAIMRSINTALGVKCNYCHVPIPGQKTPEGHQAMNFASDDKEQKRIARKMMRMTKNINERLDDIGDHQFERISCITCHRGHTQPSFTLDSMQRVKQP